MRTRRAGVGTVIVLFIMVIIVIIATLAYLSLSSQSTGPTGITSTVALATTSRNDFTLQGPIPLITLTPHNSTFTLYYNATTLDFPVASLSLALDQSFVTIYTNGTEWVPSLQACSSQQAASSTSNTVRQNQSGTITSVVTITVSGPCYVPPGPNWSPVNGSLVSNRAPLNSSQVQLSTAPDSLPANATTAWSSPLR